MFNFEALHAVAPSRKSSRLQRITAEALIRRLEVVSEVAIQPGGAPAPVRAPRTRRTAAKKPAAGGDDGDGPAPRRHAPLFYDLPSVADVLSISTGGVQAMVRSGEFPKPRLLTARRVGWLASEVEAWAASRPIADLLPPANAGQR